MKAKSIIGLLVICLALIWGEALTAVPKYTDKETALRLAKVLDEGTFGRYTITSTYVQNEDVNNFYISVILSDGSAQKWYVNQIYKWTRDDDLLLSENRALIFPDHRDSKFFVLYKNEFHQLALQANIYIKEYGEGDPLHGQRFRFRIKSFSLISPTETAFGRDERGNKYRYIIDLYNGERELFTYEDAYYIMQEKRLLIEDTDSAPTFEKAYHITQIVSQPKQEAEDGVSRFGVEVQFNQAIELTGDHFPYVIYERNVQDRKTGKYNKEFFMDFTVPNAEEKFEVPPIKNLEYLYDIHVLKDPKYAKRLILRTAFNPLVMDIPPVVYKSGENSIHITFFNLVDQSVLSRGMLLEAKKRKEMEQKSLKEIKIKRVMKKETDYSRAFIAATELHKESQAIREPLPKINKLLESIDQFEKAALLAEEDSQLFSALMQRNNLRSSVIVLTIDYVNQRLTGEALDRTEIDELIRMLDKAESFTRNEKIIKNIERLRDQLN